MIGEQFCFSHNPRVKGEHLKATRKGGSVSYKGNTVLLDPLDLSSPELVFTLLTDTINRVRQVDENGCMDVKIANCLAILAGKMLEAKKVIEIDKRMKELEEIIKEHNIRKEDDYEISEEELMRELDEIKKEDL
ncbi:TPA: hypothetical protein DDW69_00235 [candidate division CPR2 bacterium]|uniref:Uncharacterized protein n=1 Tax=candidate division CPR2 bacterium GW2011_GWC1_41_48 TaxID=1618344 RepID=A0A0G0YGP3_UNCC2|nr:MAG: hypothetical protein UT47_C0005G0022 [candidate division CPR2 bacterium GW2011_GWC2_39_35]KKS08711.1 MAG: hypothetical protein UU65_C0005G0022 [candidate division CPR2 bacterium GW2011_GWC1_41_48]OGB59789.1 MAG: hypothetical protein A2Y27_02175 [candidate division CPR2 bacterium GWD1_39_7]OGB72759.1 MAG: hypothetical protein A2Y26_04795 [candidate division CPR2 bacterium GWD2_39_7]HBG81253.1 hypothetical protein [candidate division CPR2 bacterium]